MLTRTTTPPQPRPLYRPTGKSWGTAMVVARSSNCSRDVCQWIVSRNALIDVEIDRTLLSKRWSARFSISAGRARAEAPAARLRMLLKDFMVIGWCWLLRCW